MYPKHGNHPKATKKNLVFERKILRRNFGSIKEGYTWRRRKNRKLYEHGEVDIVLS